MLRGGPLGILRLGTGRLYPHSMLVDVGTSARAIKLILNTLWIVIMEYTVISVYI
jgi:hypothetical protein